MKKMLLIAVLAFAGCQNCCQDGYVFTTRDGTYVCHFSHSVEKLDSKKKDAE